MLWMFDIILFEAEGPKLVIRCIYFSPDNHRGILEPLGAHTVCF